MKRTRPSTVVAFAIVALAAGFVFDAVLASSQRPVAVPSITLGLALLAIGAIVISLAVPVFRVARGRTNEGIDAYYATRVVLIAKASSLAGALFGGFVGGLLIYVLTRGVSVPSSTLVPTITAVVGGVVLLAAGLVAEHMCTIPPDDDDRDEGRPQQARS